jgi:hypothetical protein
MDCFNHRENALAALTVIVGGGFATTIYKKFVGILQSTGNNTVREFMFIPNSRE